MKIDLKNGIESLKFGMWQNDVIHKYGHPDRQYPDEERNIVYLYNDKKLRLTFYADEDFRLGYIISANEAVTLSGIKLIGEHAASVKESLKKKGFIKWTTESFDTYENFFNEENWFILQSEFGAVVKVELGAIINDRTDEFEWKFSK